MNRQKYHHHPGGNNYPAGHSKLGFEQVAVQYTWVVQPLALFTGFILALTVAAIYNRDLRKSFLS